MRGIVVKKALGHMYISLSVREPRSTSMHLAEKGIEEEKRNHRGIDRKRKYEGSETIHPNENNIEKTRRQS